MPTHVMLDLETMGTGSYAAIIAIGAVKFDPHAYTVGAEGAETFYMPVTLESSMKAGFRVDAGTIEWWMKPARTAARERWLAEDKVQLDEALLAFIEWFGADDTMPVWGNGAAFNNVVLSNAYLALGIDKPWGYKADRCFRTFKSAILPAVSAPVYGTAHHALDDAIIQALWLQKIVNYRSIRVG